MAEEDLSLPVVDWLNHQEATLALDTAEASFAEMCYIENHPPIPSQFVGHYTRAIPELNEPPWPIWAKQDLLFRCILAQKSIWARDESYPYYRDIYTRQDREAARERRRRAKEASRRWHEYGSAEARLEMIEALGEMHAERGRV